MLRIGTRGSALALAQARAVAEALGGPGEVELVEIVTDGDRGIAGEDRGLAGGDRGLAGGDRGLAGGDRGLAGGDKARWTSALERALLAGEVDLAVHSAKDVPGELPEGLALVAIPPRADPFDVLCGAGSLSELAAGARVGTSSLRRAAQLRALRPDLEVVPIRGNVDTRLGRLRDGEVDALVLAGAGLVRLGRGEEAGAALEELVPAPGQGALALEARPEALSAERLLAVSDPATVACVSAERDLARALDASCRTPLGAFARLAGAGLVELTGWVGAIDGSAWVLDRLSGDPALVGRELAKRMLAAGAGELLAAAEEEAAR